MSCNPLSPGAGAWGKTPAAPADLLPTFPGHRALLGCAWELRGTRRAAVGEREGIPGPSPIALGLLACRQVEPLQNPASPGAVLSSRAPGKGKPPRLRPTGGCIHGRETGRPLPPHPGCWHTGGHEAKRLAPGSGNASHGKVAAGTGRAQRHPVSCVGRSCSGSPISTSPVSPLEAARGDG